MLLYFFPQVKSSGLVRAEVPPAVVTKTVTVPLPGGEWATTSSAETTLKRAACSPKSTRSTSSNLMPRMTTVVPPALAASRRRQLEHIAPGKVGEVVSLGAWDASMAAVRLKAASFPVHKSLDEFDFSASSVPRATLD